MIKMYFFLKRNRLRKKWKLYRQLFLVTFDWTTLFYVMAYFVYVGVAIFIEGRIAFKLDKNLVQIESFVHRSYWYIMTLLPLTRTFRAFQSPGILFTTAEYHLTILPYSRTRIWLLLALERWVKTIFFYVLAGSFFYLLTPISLSFLTIFFTILLCLNILMTSVEWKFFQQSLIFKISIVILFMMVNIIAFMTESPIVAIGFVIALLIVNVLIVRKLFEGIDWQQVTAANDFNLWNMQAIAQVTKIKYKKDRKYSLWQRMKFWKKPFRYEKSAMYHRLWHIYLEKNVTLILQLMGTLLLMLIVCSFLTNWLFLLSIVLTISIYTTFAVSLFRDRLTSDLVQVLPWDLPSLHATFQRWILVSGVIFFIPIFIKGMFEFTLWTVALWFIIMFAFYFLLNLKLQRAMMRIDKEAVFPEWHYIIVYGILLIILFSGKYPILLLIGYCLVGVMYMAKQIPLIKS